MTKDYYKILEVPEFSSQEDIKIAYRKLARKWHPDIAGNTADVISQFKEINEAYEILSNSNKKEAYDRAKRFSNYASSGTKNSKKTENNSTKPDFKATSHSEQKKEEKKNTGFRFNWEEFLAQKNRKNEFEKERKTSPIRGKDIYSDVEISVFESIQGAVKTINMLQTQVCPKCLGRKFVNGGICKHCNGKGEKSSYKRFTVKIPSGIQNNSKIRLAGEGEQGINGGANGDLYLVIHIKEPKNYKTEGLNILKTISIAPFEAVLGAEKEIITQDGIVNFKISPNTQNGQKIRLNGCGIKTENKTGDMIVTIEINIQKELSREEIELYKRLKEISSANIG